MLRSRVAFDRRGAWTAGDSHEDIESIDVLTFRRELLSPLPGVTF